MLDDIPLWVLITTLVTLIVLSAFFSGAETSLISLNRYRLRHLARHKHAGALRASRLLEQPDRLIGLILIGNNLANILASFVAALMAYHLYGETGLAVAPFILTVVILVFGEVAPKTLAVMHPERIAFPAAFLLRPLMKALYPGVWLVNALSNGVLRLCGARLQRSTSQQLSREELRSVLSEAGALIPQQHKRMLTSILDLETVTVDDIMVPRNEIVGVDLDDDWEVIVEHLTNSQHTRIPVYRGDINNIAGILHVKNTLQVLLNAEASKDDILAIVGDAYFVPDGTALHSQLLNFQRSKHRIALVVNEYGDVQGLVTLEDILEEIVGDFTSDPSQQIREVHPQDDGTYLVDGGAYLREINKTMGWNFPTDGPKTLNGLIIEHLEDIPEPGTSLLIAGYPIEIVQAKDNAVKVVRINPAFSRDKINKTNESHT